MWGLIALAAVGAITGIAVTTSEQTVAPNTVSEKITVELQNASGEAEKIDESSNKLSLTSSSASGEFSSNTENWKAVNELTVNKNTASRSFYYKNGAEGDSYPLIYPHERRDGQSLGDDAPDYH